MEPLWARDLRANLATIQALLGEGNAVSQCINQLAREWHASANSQPSLSFTYFSDRWGPCGYAKGDTKTARLFLLNLCCLAMPSHPAKPAPYRLLIHAAYIGGSDSIGRLLGPFSRRLAVVTGPNKPGRSTTPRHAVASLSLRCRFALTALKRSKAL